MTVKTLSLNQTTIAESTWCLLHLHLDTHLTVQVSLRINIPLLTAARVRPVKTRPVGVDISDNWSP